MQAVRDRLTETGARSQHRPAGLLRHAVIYAATSGFAQEFYPLAVDAYVRDIHRHGTSRFRVLGVHIDWLGRDGLIRRAVTLDAERDQLIESALDPPLPPHSAQFLSLGRREQGLHRTLSGALRCVQVNPGTTGERADDKAATLEGWAGLGLRVPNTRRIDPGHAAEAWKFLAAFGDSVVKPNDATEGVGVSFLSATPASRNELSRALDCAWQFSGSALIQERSDGLLYRAPERGTMHTLALRLNVAFDGERYRLASGFAQIGADASQPASCGRGGRIVPLAETLTNLVLRDDPSCAVAGPDEALWAEITDQAERAAGLFEPLLLVGLDVILDVSASGRITPILIEANPRPAGLCHARLVSGLPAHNDIPGVGLEIWDCLEAWCSHSRSEEPGVGLPPASGRAFSDQAARAQPGTTMGSNSDRPIRA